MIRVEQSAIIDAPIDQVWALLRDFNGHDHWHPAVATSRIRGGIAADQIGAIRDFRLTSGERLSEQLLRLSDEKRAFSYSIVESEIPLLNYTAHVELKPVTDTNRTFWRWWSQFDTPPGREAELAALVRDGVYRAGFDGLRDYLGAQPPGRAAPAPQAPPGPPPGRPQAAQAIIVTRHGGPEVLELAAAHAPVPGPGEIRLRQTAIGVNYIDVYGRSGYFAMIDPPGGIGMEAAGMVIDTGPGVAHLRAGDRVAYACAPTGAYASLRTMPGGLVVPLPDDITDETAAALMLKGVTAWFLLNRVHQLQAGETALIYAPAGGVGRLLVQWASAMGATVIGATPSPEKARAARQSGAAHVVQPGAQSLEDQVRDLTGGHGVDVVFDAVGRDSFDHSVAALRARGHLVSYGQASGDIGPRDIGALAARSLTLSRPNYIHYTDTYDKISEASSAVWRALAQGTITAQIGQRFALGDAAAAHRALESRQTQGSTLLLPEGRHAAGDGGDNG